MARSRRGSTFFSPIRRKTRFERFKDFIWQPETKQFLGRTGTAWAMILFFYLCLYIFLAGFFAACMFALNATLDDHMPKYMLDDSPIGNTPGLTFRPVQSNIDLTGISLISFNSSDPTTWEKLVNQINKELNPYIAKANKECNEKETTGKENICGFNLNQLGTTCNDNNKYGYNKGEPCFLLRLNRLLGWKPEPFNNVSEKGSIDNYLAERENSFQYHPDYVGISCTSYKKGDRHLVGNITFYPKEGFHRKFFPYWNQKNYLSPLVMVQFQGMKKSEAVKVECKAWAQNVEHNRAKKRGYIRFEVKIE